MTITTTTGGDPPHALSRPVRPPRELGGARI